jgi:hypothetical protein
MGRPIGEVIALAERHKAPILLVGDVFHKTQEPAEVVNWLLRRLAEYSANGGMVYAIPGQHDLEHHSIENIKRTSYWTLVEADVIQHVSKITDVQFRPGVCSLTLHPFPWRAEITPCETAAHDFNLDVALVHKYIWTKNACFPGAPEESALGTFRTIFANYDAVVVGDNHQGFISGNVINCGTLMRRRGDEREYKPGVGLLRMDGTIDRYYLDTSRDVYTREQDMPREKASEEMDLSDFMDTLKSMGTAAVDFLESSYQYLETAYPPIADAVKERIISIVGRKP